MDTVSQTKTTQNQMILRHLEAGHIITTMKAFRMFGITSLAKRICELKEQGHRIQTGRCKLPSGKYCCVYSL